MQIESFVVGVFDEYWCAWPYVIIYFGFDDCIVCYYIKHIRQHVDIGDGWFLSCFRGPVLEFKFCNWSTVNFTVIIPCISYKIERKIIYCGLLLFPFYYDNLVCTFDLTS